MGNYIYDAGNRYLVRNEDVEAAKQWLEQETDACEFTTKPLGSYAVIEGTNKHYDPLFCGETHGTYNYLEDVKKFMDKFCLIGSYGCFQDFDFPSYTIVYKTEYGVVDECIEWENPFAAKMKRLDETEVEVRTYACPDCASWYDPEAGPILEYEGGVYTCPQCGCSTSFPEEDACYRL